MRWTSSRTINAPVERVFRTVADPDEFQRAIPGGSSVEYLTPNRTGVGVRFRATRVMKGKPSTFEQEVTEFAPPEQVRLVNVTHGTVWDSTFRLQSDGGATVLTLTMDAQTERLLAWLMTRLIAGMVQQALDGDMDAVKAYCERQPAP
jgi:carbon monoxide dehydrogenase subunit G